MAPSSVTVCIPVFNAADFVRETLESVRAQLCDDLRVLIAVDRSEDESAAICRAAAATDSRWTVIEHRERLGWVGNVNALLGRVETPYSMILPHDDVLHPDYVRTMLRHLEAAPAAVAAFSDMELFGDEEGPHQQRSVLGSLPARVTDFLTGHFDAVAFRALARHSRLAGDVLLRNNTHEGFAADTLWVLQLACRGELHRIPAALYRKRRRPTSVVGGWKSWPRDRLLAAWVDHCADCCQVVLPVAADDTQRSVFILACVGRLLSVFSPLWLEGEIHPRSEEEKLALVALFVTRMLERPAHLPAMSAVLADPALDSTWARMRASGPPLATTPLRRGLLGEAISAVRSVARRFL